MVIVFVADQYDALNNGTTISARRFTESLREQGHTVRVITTGIPGPDKFILPLLKIPLVSWIAKKQGIIFSKADPVIIRKALEGADIVHFYLPFPMARVTEKIAREMGIPCIAGFHVQAENITYNIGLAKNEKASRFFYKFLYKYFFNRFSDIHCPSQFIADELKANGYNAKFHVISNGVADVFKPLPALPHKKFNILMTGRLSPEKRQDLIIKAAKLSKYSDKIQLYFAGNGPLYKKYNKMSKGLANPPVFKFYTPEELLQQMRSIDLYVHASDIEIEAIACMEAFSCGLVPVIANAPKSATVYFAINEKSLFEEGNPQSLADKIDYWIEHPEEKALLSKQYIEQSKQYSISKSTTKMTEVYKTIIEENKTNGKN